MDIFEFFSMFPCRLSTLICANRLVMSSGMGKDVWTLTPTQITNTAKVSLCGFTSLI